MGKERFALAAILFCLAGCGSGNKSTGGSGGSGGGGGSTDPLTENLMLLSHSPADDAVQVALDASIVAEFDGSILQECLQDEDNYLSVAGQSEHLAGSYAQSAGGRTLRFTPSQPLAPQTDYTFHLSPLLCDTRGRILEEAVSFTFRTLDTQPPAVVAASVADHATGVSRTSAITVTFDEPISAASVTSATVYLRDKFGNAYATSSSTSGATLVVAPVADLAGERSYVLVVQGGSSGVKDRAGNVLAAQWSISFKTAADTTPPALVSAWPGNTSGISPRAQPMLAFSESMDPQSFEPASVALTDEFQNLVAYTVVASPDQKLMRIAPHAPLVAGRVYTLTLLGGAGGPTDLSGNPLADQQSFRFTTGSDDVPPVLTTSMPADGAPKVSLNVQPDLTFDEALDPTTVNSGSVVLDDGERTLETTVALHNGGTSILIVPSALLRPGRVHTITVRGSYTGIRDQAGNVLAADLVRTFRSADDTAMPQVILAPNDGNVAVPTGAKVSAVFDAPMDPESLNAASVQVSDTQAHVLPATLSVSKGDRVVQLVPATPWTPGAWYTVVVKGGPDGVRRLSGNWLGSDVVHQFRVGFLADALPPNVSVTLNQTVDLRKEAMTVPPCGFEIDVRASDALDYSLDVGTLEVTLSGTGACPDAAAIFAQATVSPAGLAYVLPVDRKLAPGMYTLTATVRDLSGNIGSAVPLQFQVGAASNDVLPFELTQVVWVRFDLDRNGNARSDFEDDLVQLGLISASDPIGSNQRMIGIVRDGILAETNSLYSRSATGSWRGADSVALRLTWRRPYGIAHTQIACGGLDPEGSARRKYGDDSTGVLGRAFFDYRNSQVNDLDIGTRPGLGVFPAELFLYQAKIHIQLYPQFITSFARRFLNLAPAMGGTPAGEHALDAVVLSPGFDFGSATTAERARYLAVFDAADDWATAVGIILAHEIGHSVGLTASGPNPLGLHGDATLHNELSDGTDVMAAAVGYDSLISLPYAFRDLNIAYLRQRLLLR